MNLNDTIAAIATPVGEGGLGIIRISGDDSYRIAKKLFTPKARGDKGKELKSHFLYYGTIRAKKGTTVDEVCLIYMKKPRSYTRQDTVEISCHGSPATMRKLLKLTIDCGARTAEPGEYTKRAFLNGRINLSQAEGVIDFIKARSEGASRAALHLMQGGLSLRIEAVKEHIVKLLAHLEASIDFPDEEMETQNSGSLMRLIDDSISKMNRLIKSYDTGRFLKKGISLAIVGKPNVGKSSLLNALLEEERAIVTPHPGTTRDLIRVKTELSGLEVELIDTAGLNPAPGEVEAIGIEMAMQAAQAADLLLVMFDGSRHWDDGDSRLLEILGTADRFVVVVNKSDLPQLIDWPEESGDIKPISISVKERSGLDELVEKISALFQDSSPSAKEEPVVTRTRHLEIFQRIVGNLQGAKQELSVGRELAAASAWSALEEIKRFTGESYTEEVLSAIFDEFCVGK